MWKRLLSARRVVIISDYAIESRREGFLARASRFVLFLWLVLSTSSFFFGLARQRERAREVFRLKLINGELSERVENLTKAVSELGHHFHTLNYYDRFSRFDMDRVAAAAVSPEEAGKQKLSRVGDYARAKLVLAELAKNVSLINDEIELRVDGLRGVLRLVSLDSASLDAAPGSEGGGATSRMLRGLERLALIEQRLNLAPLMEPMRDYRVSSRYGLRPDPFSGAIKVHSGIDLAGPHRSAILAPAQGLVVAVRSSRGLGKTIVLDHGQGITTTYGHLDQAYVSVGDRVNRGDSIAVQGGSGIRSTGSHLHYEVSVPMAGGSGNLADLKARRTPSRTRTSPVDPNNFMRAGKLLDIAVSTGNRPRKKGSAVLY
ncbi:MAG: M23 family metallopeptidase [Rickettsiales bacterium]|jgi:murein DD-endopeptidase MepM/ murein hydrolase activator NlpD|nr:M23 family metallopeptidase [Rickettsiales bacterium]